MLKFISRFGFIIITLLFFGILLHYFLALNAIRPRILHSSVIIYTLTSVVFFIITIMMTPIRPKKISWAIFGIWCLITILLIPFNLLYVLLATNDFELILEFLTSNSVSDATDVTTGSLLTTSISYLIQYSIMIIISGILIYRYAAFRWVILLCSILMLCFNPFTKYLVNSNIISPEKIMLLALVKTKGIEIISRPKIKKNLIFIYLESLERTYRDIDETRNEYALIDSIVKSGMEFTNIHQVKGADITIRGIIASQCGIPLLPLGVFRFLGRSKKLKSLKEVVPNTICISDILAEDNYITSYLSGDNLNSFSHFGFLNTHHYQRIFGLHTIKNSGEDGGIYTDWGLTDAVVFKYAKRELRKLKNLNKPFLMTMLTISTHGPDAFLDLGCEKNNPKSAIPAAIKCTASLLDNFLTEVENLGLKEDTIIVIMSDHLAMANTLEKQLLERQKERRIIFSILNASQMKQIDRAGSHFDIFPTVLNSLGFEMKNNEANFGNSLLRKEKNLIEKLGKNVLNKGIHTNLELAKYLWAPKPNQ